MGILKVRSTLIEGVRSVVDNRRGHSIITDLPENQNGEDTGATALELAVMAYASCLTTIYSLIAKNKKRDFKSITVEIEALKPEKAKTIEEVKIKAEIKAMNKEDAKKTWNDTLKACPVGELFNRARVKTSIELNIIG